MTRETTAVDVAPAFTRVEQQLLVACARPHLDRTAIASLVGDGSYSIHWPYVLRTADAHGVLPLVHRALAATPDCDVPPEVFDTLAADARRDEMHNRTFAGVLEQILGACEHASVEVMPFKGPVLTELAYGDVAAREIRDLDVLVRREDLDRAAAVLASLGFRRISDKTRPPSADDYHLFVREQAETRRGRVRVDLQWRIMGPEFAFPIDDDTLWKRLESVSWHGRRVRALPVEELLLLLCVHGSKHRWELLKWIADVAHLIQRRRDLDWQRLYEAARDAGLARMLSVGLIMAFRVLAADVDERALHRSQADRDAQWLTRQLVPRLFDTQLPDAAGRGAALRSMYVRMRERRRDRVRLRLQPVRDLGRRVFVPNDRDRALVRLPRVLGFAYYVVRPLRLTGRCAASVLRRVVSPPGGAA
jgi:hypothetical protein